MNNTTSHARLVIVCALTATSVELQSNSVSLTSPGNWHLVPGSTAANAMSFGVGRPMSKVFFRLSHP